MRLAPSAATGHSAAFEQFESTIPEVDDILDRIQEIERYEIGQINHEIEEYRRSGAIDVIIKPFDPMKLATTVQEIWSRHHAQDPGS